ncbi:MAG: methionine aminotransferase [Bacteroidota bacterium]|nr:methionine aminotransferase [Candidatus Kapabacteria bacterium]MDW8272428.1 methionine aminotransferase [Bacteroidota bacterium]
MRISGVVAEFGSSIFSEMSALAQSVGAINLGQGFPDFDPPATLMAAACRAIEEGHNQYAISHGEPALRQAIAEHAARWYGQHIDPDCNVCVTCGASEALWCAVQAVVGPGDEVIVLEPTFDVYVPDIRMVRAVPVPVVLQPPDFRLDPDALRAAVSPRTRAIIVNTPHNPTGRVFSPEELAAIAQLCIEHDLVAIADEVYEHIVFAPHRHIRLATLDGMAERTITISSGAKTFAATGWKCGWAIGPEPLITAIRRVHQFTTFASATPFQYAIAEGLRLGDEFFATLQADYTRRRAVLLEALAQTPLKVFPPEGAYYVVADISTVANGTSGYQWCRWLAEHVGVAAIPLEMFYLDPAHGRSLVRFAFCKREETLLAAAERLVAHAAALRW